MMNLVDYIYSRMDEVSGADVTISDPRYDELSQEISMIEHKFSGDLFKDFIFELSTRYDAQADILGRQMFLLGMQTAASFMNEITSGRIQEGSGASNAEASDSADQVMKMDSMEMQKELSTDRESVWSSLCHAVEKINFKNQNISYVLPVLEKEEYSTLMRLLNSVCWGIPVQFTPETKELREKICKNITAVDAGMVKEFAGSTFVIRMEQVKTPVFGNVLHKEQP